MAFQVHQRIDMRADEVTQTHGLIRTVSVASIQSFKASSDANKYGVYVFGLRNPGGAVNPWYVGLAKQQTFGDEAMTKDKLRKYSACMYGRNGSPSITLVSWSKPDSEDLIDDLERLLIWIARDKNPNLLNARKVSSAPGAIIRLVNKLEIKGVLNRGAGKPSHAANNFMAMMGLS